VSPYWVIPAVVFALGITAVGIAARRLAAEIAALRPALARVDDIRTSAAAAARDLRSTWTKGSSLAVVDRFRAARATIAWRRLGR
jgi:hypothetical protein